MSKKNPAPVLKCLISGQSRKTSHNYLASKASRLGVSSDWLLNNYVSKYVCSQLRAGRNVSDLATDGWSGTDEQLKELVQKNSKSRVTDFWFESGTYKTAKPTPKKREEKVQSLDDVVQVTAGESTLEAIAKTTPEPEPEPATFNEALAELQELN
tara:strand:- start:164 stop:628 length:465 start_codon:yes stop_codon:yes gene_type:complete